MCDYHAFSRDFTQLHKTRGRPVDERRSWRPAPYPLRAKGW
jgi:hypothetical protein